MTMTAADDEAAMTGAGRSQAWRWYICVLLLLATVVNYMDRLTANTLATEIQAEFALNNKQYGYLELGFGLAFGVLLDAFVVRMLLIPAAMHLLGESAWWLPTWLDRILPDVDVEGARLERSHVGDGAGTRAGG